MNRNTKIALCVAVVLVAALAIFLIAYNRVQKAEKPDPVPSGATEPSVPATSGAEEPASSGEEEPETVYITASGSKYHIDRNCSSLSRSSSVSSMTLAEAESAGYEPCMRCIRD